MFKPTMIAAVGVALGMALLMATSAVANVDEPAFRLTAANANGTAVFQRSLSQFAYDPSLGYSLDVWSPVNLMNGSQYVARLNGLHVYITDDPALYASIYTVFTVDAGNTDTTFTVTPGVTSFSPIPQPFAAASMSWGFTVSDSVASGDSHVLMQGVPSGEDIYKTWYNGSTPFGNSATELQAWGQGAVGTLYDNIPTMGYTSLPVPVSQINVQTAFTLTRMDTADVNTSLVLDVPEPGTLGLVALGIGALVWRRR
jgi:hypothetical protein